MSGWGDDNGGGGGWGDDNAGSGGGDGWGEDANSAAKQDDRRSDGWSQDRRGRSRGGGPRGRGGGRGGFGNDDRGDGERGGWRGGRGGGDRGGWRGDRGDRGGRGGRGSGRGFGYQTSGGGGGGGWGNENKSTDGGGWGDDNKTDGGGGWGDDNKSNGGGWESDNKPSGGAESKGSGGWGDNGNEASGGWGGSQGEPNKRSRGDWSNNEDDGQNKRPRREGEEEGERPAPYKPDELDLDEEAKLQGDGAGENFQRYEDQKVICFPKDLFSPVQKFEDIVTSKLLLENISKQKYTSMTPIQKWAMPAIVKGHDLIGCAQTGSGKTAAFLLPILQTLLNSELETQDPNDDCVNPYCLIISPTRELANQINVHAQMLSKDSIIKCVVIYGQISTHHLKSKLQQGCHILVATPGRLKDFVERGWIGFKNIKYVILDEGDRLVDEGFSSDIKNFLSNPQMPPKEDRQTLFFSATFKQDTQVNAKAHLKDDFIFLTVGRIGAANQDIKQEFLQVSREAKKRELKKILTEVPDSDKCIVFTQTKNAADMLAGFFTALNLSSTSIHGDRLQSQREQAIKQFKRGEKKFLISSPVGNRGLDLPKVSLVINYDLPNNIDEYVHRIGRTGRAGHTGRAISFYDETRDKDIIPELIEILTEAKQEIPDWMTGTTSASNEPAGGDDWGASTGAPQPASGGDDDWGAPATTATTAPSANDDDWGAAPPDPVKKETPESAANQDDAW